MLTEKHQIKIVIVPKRYDQKKDKKITTKNYTKPKKATCTTISYIKYFNQNYTKNMTKKLKQKTTPKPTGHCTPKIEKYTLKAPKQTFIST